MIPKNLNPAAPPPHSAPVLRVPTFEDFHASLSAGIADFRATPGVDLFFASFFVGAGIVMALVTYLTGQTFWLVLAVLGFPLVGALASVGFYEVSRRRQTAQSLALGDIAGFVWGLRGGQLPWLAAIVVVVFLFWFFLGHMIFALFLGLSPMTNVSTSLDVFWSPNGLMMIGFGTLIGAVFATLVFAITVHGMPMLIDRDIDFMTAALTSAGAVAAHPFAYLVWGGFIAVITLVSMLLGFAGLFITMPVLGHASWHLYDRLSEAPT